MKPSDLYATYLAWAPVLLAIVGALVTVIPVFGNAMIARAKRKGDKASEDFWTRWTPIAVAASKSKTREEALSILVHEVLNPDTPPASEAATTAAAILLPTVAPPASSSTPAAEIPKPPPLPSSTPTLPRDWPPKPPVPPMAPMMCLALLLLVGCAGGAGQADRAIDSMATAISKSEPIVRAAYAKEIEACPDAPCVHRVQAEWEPVVKAFDEVHKVWCVIVPNGLGCS